MNNLFPLLPLHNNSSIGDTTTTILVDECNSSTTGALEQARALKAPIAKSKTKGDIEDANFWEDHDRLFQRAREEWGKKHENIYRFDDNFISTYLNPDVKEAIEHKSIHRLKSLVQSSEKDGVYKIRRLFNEEFIQTFLEELEYQETSEIPMRRPNGMNRYGCILNELGFETFLKEFSDRLLKPIAHILFPHRVSVVHDLTTEYGFVVKYHPNTSDINLTEHADASAITVNTCLIPSSEEDSAPLYFKNVREIGESEAATVAVATNVTLDTPGDVVFHLGQHIHGVSDVSSARSNMIIWMMGDYGYVRVAPYESYEIDTNQAIFQSMYGWN